MFELSCAEVVLDDGDADDASCKSRGKIGEYFRNAVNDVFEQSYAYHAHILRYFVKADEVCVAREVSSYEVADGCADDARVPAHDEDCSCAVEQREYRAEYHDLDVIEEYLGEHLE